MKALIVSSLFVLSTLVFSACGATPVANLALPPVSTIEGAVTRIDKDGFDLSDSSGSIFVRAISPGDDKLDVELNENVTIYGNLLGGTEKIFDGYVIQKSSGEQIIISEPSPHFGLVIQSSFR